MSEQTTYLVVRVNNKDKKLTICGTTQLDAAIAKRINDSRLNPPESVKSVKSVKKVVPEGVDYSPVIFLTQSEVDAKVAAGFVSKSLIVADSGAK